MTRFSEFQRSLGCAKNILSARLAKLVEREVLTLDRRPMAAPTASTGSPRRARPCGSRS
ncbi:hypothetical protein [Streptomyces sp. NPDC058545]|uniref:hypothetical protein n=1 Tax=Streptomyces sp. NPDC058545 TaxID=3346544 RepID=UPI003664B47B